MTLITDVAAFREYLFEGKKESGYICYMQERTGELVMVFEDYKGTKKYGVFLADDGHYYDERGEKLDINNK